MNVNATSPTTPASTSGNTSMPNSAQVMSDTFMKLLVAQLKGQSPLDPVDPTQFVSQLAQLNQLSETVQIRQILQGFASKSGSANPTQPTSGGH